MTRHTPPTTLIEPSTRTQSKVARFTFHLRGLEGRLQALADERGTTRARIVREAVMSQMDDLPTEKRAGALPRELKTEGARIEIRVRFTHEQAEMLTTRARAASLTKGDYIASLMDGAGAPADPGRLICALMSVADRLATFSADLSRFARHAGGGHSCELQGLPTVLEAMHRDIRGDMVAVAETLKQLTHARKTR